jgi:hypothetical protein
MKLSILAASLILFLSGCQNFDGERFMKNFGEGLAAGSNSYSYPNSYSNSYGGSTMCPDGSYVSGTRCNLCPNGQYVSGSCVLMPNGQYIGR